MLLWVSHYSRQYENLGEELRGYWSELRTLLQHGKPPPYVFVTSLVNRYMERETGMDLGLELL